MHVFRINVYLLVAVALLLTAFSCEKNEPEPEPVASDYSITFLPRIGSEKVEIGKTYLNNDGYPFSLNDIRFYLSDIRLYRKSGEVLPLSEIEFFSIRDQRSTATFRVPPGSYDSIAFNLGVPAELNSPDNPDFLISAFSAIHPLSEANGMYWIWESGYRFFSIEGHCDTVANTAEVLPLQYSFHTGRDTLYREISPFYQPLEVGDGRNIVQKFAIDLDTFFKNGDRHIDLKSERAYHGSLDQMNLGIKVADNSAACFTPTN